MVRLIVRWTGDGLTPDNTVRINFPTYDKAEYLSDGMAVAEFAEADLIPQIIKRNPAPLVIDGNEIRAVMLRTEDIEPWQSLIRERYPQAWSKWDASSVML